MDASEIAVTYDEYYFQNCCGAPYVRGGAIWKLFERIAERIAADISPKTVLDAGCAKGFLVEALRRRGIEAWGVDVSEFAIANVHESIRPYCSVASVTAALPRRYDLIVCQEVLEHMPQAAAEAAVDNLCQHADDVLFSSSPYDFREPTHVNMHPPEYWVGQFARRQFFHDLEFDLSVIAPWAMRFRRSQEPTWRIVAGYARKQWWYHQENGSLREVNIKQRLRISELERHLGWRVSNLVPRRLKWALKQILIKSGS